MGILESIINSIKGLVSSVKGAFNNDPRYTQNFDWYPGSGGGGDVTKAYVDEKDGLLSDRIDTLNTYKADKSTTLAGYGITNAYTKTEDDALLADKVDKINITAQGIEGLYPVTINEQGQIVNYGTKQTPSDTYNSTANNQLLTRKGAYNMYNDITQVKDKGWTNIISGVQYCCKNRVVSIRMVGTSVAADANGIIANVPSGYRPTQETPFCYGIDFGAVMDKGGWIATNGEIRVHVYSTTLNQVRMFLTYTI